MKKMLTIAVATGLISAASAEFVNWKPGPSFQAGYDYTTIDGVTTEAGWLVQLYASDTQHGVANAADWYNSITMNTDGTMTSGITAGDSMLSVTSALALNLGKMQFTGVNGAEVPGIGSTGTDKYLYTVVFNGDTVTEASHFSVLDLQAVLTPPNSGMDSGGVSVPVADYITGSLTSGGASDWIAIPEPATIGMMGIAGLGMFLARKKSRR